MRNFNRGSRPGRGFGRAGGGRSFGGSRGFGGRGDREMFHAVCANCGNDCEVPFNPTGSKPVLCSNCFSKDQGAEPRRFSDRGPRREPSRDGGAPKNNRQLDEINRKLDEVLALLNGVPVHKPSKKAPKVQKEVVVAPVSEPVIDTAPLDVSDVLSDSDHVVDPINNVNHPIESDEQE